MIRYIPQAQLTLEGFQTPFSQHLNKVNRWVKLANSMPWDKLANIYYKKMNSDFGAPSLSARMVIGAVIIKHMLNIDDREVIVYRQRNIISQCFNRFVARVSTIICTVSFAASPPYLLQLIQTYKHRPPKFLLMFLMSLVL